MKKLSFILPIYNVAAYVTNCLNSLYAQGLDEEEFEVICINDASPDNSVQIIEQYREQHHCDNLMVKTILHAGLSGARNAGVLQASGEYLFFVDSDDYIAENTVKPLLARALEQRVDMLYFDSCVTSENDRHKARYLEEKAYPVLNGKQYFAEYFPGNSACLFLIRRNFMVEKQLRFEEGHYCEDGMFAVLSTNRAERITYCHADVYRYVKRANSIVSKKDQVHLRKMIDDFVYTINYINAFVSEENAADEKTSNYGNRLIKRRDSYTFFLQVRMLKAKLDRRSRVQIMRELRENGCYPNAGLEIGYGKKMCFLAKVFQKERLYHFLSGIYRLIF